MAKKDVVYIYTGEYYPVIKNEILPSPTTWLDMEGIMLSKISQTEKDKYCLFSCTCKILKKKKKNEYNLQI